MLYVDVIVEQATWTADISFTLSEDTAGNKISENERECRKNLFAQSVDQPSPIISQVPPEVVPDFRTLTKKEVQELNSGKFRQFGHRFRFN